ncbi:MAG: heme ABC transporter permease CcmC [Methylococcales bacterium]|nr:heme ABC transporter permease CcmC [Methylococcales bacterium]
MKINMPRWFYQLASPKWSYDFMGILLPWFATAALLLLGVGFVWGLVFAPPDYQQGNSYRIIFIHVPSAILAQSCFMLMAVASGIGLVWKMKVAHIVAKSAAPIGASMTIIALATGAIWGKPTWGAWWVWDARLTSMLILLFLYVGIIALYSAFSNKSSGEQAAAILTLVGLVNIPIIKYSVEWWNTLHQPATFTLTKKPAMPPEMWLPLLVMVLGYYCFFAFLLMARTRLELLERENKSSWVIALINEKI